MKPSSYLVETAHAGRLYVMPKPSGEWLEDDITELSRMGITHLVSLLETDEAGELGLGQEQMHCANVGVGFINFPIVDRGLPVNTAAFVNLATSLAPEIGQGGLVAIHCRAGIGRTGMLASCVYQCNRNVRQRGRCASYKSTRRSCAGHSRAVGVY